MEQSNKPIQPVEISLIIAGETYKGEGETMLDALNNLEKPKFVKTRGLLKVKCGKLAHERNMTVPNINRLFAKDFVRVVLAKKLNLFLR